MEVIKSTVGESILYICTVDIGEYEDIKTAIPTSVSVKDAFDKIKDFVNDCASQFGKTLDKMEKGLRPSEVELELSIGVTGEANLVLMKSTGEFNVKIKLTWK